MREREGRGDNDNERIGRKVDEKTKERKVRRGRESRLRKGGDRLYFSFY